MFDFDVMTDEEKCEVFDYLRAVNIRNNFSIATYYAKKLYTFKKYK